MSCFMTLALTAFFCRISNPLIGGTYMTLLNTIYFLGWILLNNIYWNVIDNFTTRTYYCSKDEQNTCSTREFITVSIRVCLLCAY